MKELFKKGQVKGTVILCAGNEATNVGTAISFRPGHDVLGLLHRDLGSHLVLGTAPSTILCQFMANEKSPTHGREGNVHFGDAANRKFPMISHLGNMLAPVVGGTWAARQRGEDVFGLAVIGDGGSSTGDFHESINLASVRKAPVLFLIENNHLSYSTPAELQYNCKNLSDRAAGYGIGGKTVDGTDVWEVYSAVCDALEWMSSTSLPYLLESDTVRLEGHAAYDNAEYVSAAQREAWRTRDPLPKTRKLLVEELGVPEAELRDSEAETDDEIDQAISESLPIGRPSPHSPPLEVYAPSAVTSVQPYAVKNVRNLNAINAALEYLLAGNPAGFICGQDIGVYGSAFKSCKGLLARFGSSRVIDMPVCESAMVGFCLGATQLGQRPIIEFQFADFGTEAVTQLGLNSGTWYFRAGQPAPLLVRLPCGGGITLGAFHSGEFEGLWSRFPGLKLLYPTTPQECFEALVAGFHDPNPCIVFEHKKLYWGKQGDIDFDGDLAKVWRCRRYTEGDKLTIVATGAMVELAIGAVKEGNFAAEVWNPFILNPLSMDPVIESVRRTGRLLVVQESGETAGLGDRIVSLVVRTCGKALRCVPELIGAPDMPVPFAKELETHYLPGQDRIRRVIETMIGESR